MMLRNCYFTAALSLAIIACIGATADADDDNWVSLFDGKTIEGWTKQGGYATYKAEDGMIIGTTAEGSRNTFLCKGPFREDMDATGFIGLQVHGIRKGTGPYHVRWKNIRIRELKAEEQIE
jgi:hypothetical protein